MQSCPLTAIGVAWHCARTAQIHHRRKWTKCSNVLLKKSKDQKEYIFLDLFIFKRVSVSGARGGQKRVSGPLELQSWAVESCYVGSESRTHALWKSNKCS